MTSSDDFYGMRWIKCDLHVHTPEDTRHWNDDSIRIPSPRSEQDLQEKARAYLAECHGRALECIAVVDHNFSVQEDPRQWFLTHLIEQNITVAESLGRLPVTIFPGFELDIRYHVLCLYDSVRKGKELQKLSDILANMGLAPNARLLNGVPQQPNHQGRCWSLREVLDKVQNETGGIVIAAHAFSNDGICSDTANIQDYCNNDDLFAIEINSWPPSVKEKSILRGTNQSWKRATRHPTAICGSDTKSISNASGSNNLGCRFTWIKMSEPSIEALRQAFLDPESRICFELEPPWGSHTHIQRLKVEGTRFLQDQTIALSPNLNCFIGGRGSGKSMLFESMRLAMRGESSFNDTNGNDNVAARQVKRLQGTFQSNAAIEMRIAHDDMEDTFVVDGFMQPARIKNREVDHAPTVFRRLGALIFSQEEVTQLADRQKSLLDFIDSLAPERLEAHRAKSHEIIEKLKEARQTEEKISRLESELLVIKQEMEELGRRLTAKTQVQEELTKHRSAQEAKHYIEALLIKAQKTKQSLIVALEGLSTELSISAILTEGASYFDFIRQAEEKAKKAFDNLSLTISNAVEKLNSDLQGATSQHPDWQKFQEAISKAESDFYAACDEKGLTIDEAAKLKETEQEYREKHAAFQSKKDELDLAAKQKPDPKKLFEDLADCWKAESRGRRELLTEITQSETMPRTKAGDPIIKTSLLFSGDRDSFLELWGKWAPDRRTAVGRAWDRYDRERGTNNLGDALFDSFQSGLNSEPTSFNYGNPFQWLEANGERKEVLPQIILQNRGEIENVRRDKADMWFKLMLTRIPDSADLILLRSDGTEAGAFSKEGLSTGQKNTAILSLLLARGNGPVLIDQPEDELDNEFLYRELVTMLRKAKRKRQLIIVTHNANIPVNADAELVYALKAENGRGKCRTQGGLDRPDVTQAVLDIMEGSKEAFMKRKEKYHF